MRNEEEAMDSSPANGQDGGIPRQVVKFTN